MSKNAKPKLETHFSTAEASPGFLLWKAANLLQKTHNSVLGPLKITPAQFSMMTCLVYLAENGDVTSAQIAKHSGLDKMMISDLVKTLAKKKMIKTKANPNDGRSFLIEPTEQGAKLTNQAIQAVEKTDSEFFKSEKELKKLMGSLLGLIAQNAE